MEVMGMINVARLGRYGPLAVGPTGFSSILATRLPIPIFPHNRQWADWIHLAPDYPRSAPGRGDQA